MPGRDVERREVQAVLGRSRDAGLVLAVELVGRRARGAAAARPSAAAVAAAPAPAAERETGRARAGEAEQAAPGEPRVAGSLLGVVRHPASTPSTVWVRLRQRLGEGVHLVGELLALRVGHRVVEREAGVEAAVLGEQRVEGGELLLDVGDEASPSAPLLAARSRTLPNATSAPCTLAWKSQRSVCDHQSSSPVILPAATSSSRPIAPLLMSARVTVKSRIGDQVEQLLHVGDQAVGELGALFGGRRRPVEQRVGAVGVEVARGRRPEVLLHPVEAGPVEALGEGVDLAVVDLRVEVAERLGGRLDPLVEDARRGEQRTRRARRRPRRTRRRRS